MTEVYIAVGETGKAASLQARAAAFDAHHIPQDAEVRKTVLGKPYLADYPGVFYNISHAGTYGICAISDTPVGADVEIIRPLRRNLAARFFTPAEQEWLSTRPEEQFFRLWTRKEAYIKAIGKGLTKALESFDVLNDLNIMDGISWYYVTQEVADGFLTVCAQEPEVCVIEL